MKIKNISNLKILQEAIVEKIIAKEPIKSRLFAMGIVKGAKIKVLEHTLAKQTWDILSNNTKIALRQEEANKVLIHE